MTMTSASLNGRVRTGGVNDHDIDPAAKPTRRTFSVKYKTEILAEYNSQPKGSDERGAILRREGLYSSHISAWRKQADAGARGGLAPTVEHQTNVDGRYHLIDPPPGGHALRVSRDGYQTYELSIASARGQSHTLDLASTGATSRTGTGT